MCLQAMLDVHVTAPFKLILAVTPLMREAAKQEHASHVSSAVSICYIDVLAGNAGGACDSAVYAAREAAQQEHASHVCLLWPSVVLFGRRCWTCM
jgi:NAD(P)-dependent dehydrogenase (short-subunit alcohol dehydrogenase family)